jgi:hypothetical protein
MMNDFFEHHRTLVNYFDLNEPEEIQKFIANNPPGAVTWVESEEDHTKHIYKLNDMVLIREKGWDMINT